MPTDVVKRYIKYPAIPSPPREKYGDFWRHGYRDFLEGRTSLPGYKRREHLKAWFEGWDCANQEALAQAEAQCSFVACLALEAMRRALKGKFLASFPFRLPSPLKSS